MRRDLQKRVLDLLPRMGGAQVLFDAAEQGMRQLRGIADHPSLSSSADHLPELKQLLLHDDALGQIYQAINSRALEDAYRATSREGRKFTAAEIPAVTQLFTPRWVVDFLLQNTLGRIWRQMHPDTGLHPQWKWLVDSVGQAPSAQNPRKASDLRICDPACGTMNFGLVALDMLRQMYREELARAGAVGWPEKSCNADSEIDACILRHNLFGFDIDPMALDLARRSLEIKIGRKLSSDECNLQLADALFDSSVENQAAGGFDVVVTNPPYLSARNLPVSVVARMKKRFPSGWRDAYACFILRSLELLNPGGRAGILTMHSFMFTAAFERMRQELSEAAMIQTVAHFGPGLFEIGNPGTLQTAAVVMQKQRDPNHRATFFRLVAVDDKQTALAEAISDAASANRFEVEQSQLSAMPRGAWMYWISAQCRRAFSEFPKLGDIAQPRQGLATTDNMRFVRYWWEVEAPGFSPPRQKWLPYAKGGRFRRWHEAARHRVNWEDDGREIKQEIIDRYPYLNGQWQWVAKNSKFYGQPGITYSYLTSGAFSARVLEEGTLFDVAGSSLFPADPLTILGILNSSTARRLLAAINPTVNFQVGDLRELPLPRATSDELRAAVARAIELTRRLDSYDQTSPGFMQPLPWDGLLFREINSELAHLQKKIDIVVADLYGVEQEPAQTAAADQLDRCELARHWVSFALGIWLGRWRSAPAGEFALLSPLDTELAHDLTRILAKYAGEQAAREIEEAVNGLETFLGRDFPPWHGRLYRGRPVFWGFSHGARAVVVSSLRADRALLSGAFAAIDAHPPDSWQRFTDDGVAINLAPLSAWITDRKLQKSLNLVAEDLHAGRHDFSWTSRWFADCRRKARMPVS
jgi:hypothetical protein